MTDDDNAKQGVYVVFDGPPGPESGRFIETEDGNGHGVSVEGAEWRQRDDGYWEWGPVLPASGYFWVLHNRRRLVQSLTGRERAALYLLASERSVQRFTEDEWAFTEGEWGTLAQKLVMRDDDDVQQTKEG